MKKSVYFGKLSLILTSSLAFVLFFSACLFAQTPAAEVKPSAKDPYKDFPKSGILSGSYTKGGEGMAVSGPWAKKDSAPTSKSPISGSVSRASGKQWRASVFNNSPDNFSVSLKIRQLNKNGDSIKTDHFTLSLKAGQSAERLFSATQSAVNAELDLLTWNKTSSAKPIEDQAEDIAEQEE